MPYLSQREAAVLYLIGCGKTSKEIAGLLKLSVETISTYRKAICKKLDLHCTAELAAFAANDPAFNGADRPNNPLFRGIVQSTRSPLKYNEVSQAETFFLKTTRYCGCAVLFTGLSGAGKTTLAKTVSASLIQQGHAHEILDGDVVRRHLWRELGYSTADRYENLSRMTFIAEMLTRNGITALISAIAPYRAARTQMRSKLRLEFGHFSI
jgi:DNA-binding CsgD family transcriptional regulator